MRVKTRLQFNVAVAVLTALVIAAVLFLAMSRVNRAMEQSNIASEIITRSFERSTIRNDYLQTGSERAKKQWYAKDTQIVRLLQSARDRFPPGEDSKTIEELIKDNVATRAIFSAIVESRSKTRTDPESAATSREAESRLVNQMRMRLYDRMLYARTLHEGADSRLGSAHRTAGVVIIGALLIGAAAAIGNSWTMSRIIADRIQKLRIGATVIGGGNLRHRIDLEDADEFSEVSQAFNAMTERLSSSHLQLETEVAERKSAENALQRLNEELEMRVARRTEELDEILTEQEMQHEELQAAYHELEARSAERIAILEELRQNEQILIQQSRLAAMGEMLGYIAHQWRQPLNVLGLHIQELGLSYQQGIIGAAQLEGNIDQAMVIIQHLSQTIDDFRNFNTQGKEKMPFLVHEALMSTVRLIEESFRQQNIAIEVSCSGAPRINGHPSEFGQVILNLLANSRDALQELGAASGLIKVHCRDEDGKAIVTVTDNAGGIKQEILDKIFDAYFTTKELGKGSGVGLFMSKIIIEKNLGGQLSVRNLHGGSQFTIEV
jgi:signal transduction histidine kinase/HAMP domain-containing protein